MTKLSAKELDLLQRVDEKVELRALFFRKVKGIKWFEALDSRGYFKPEQNPKPVATKEGGFVNIPHWSAVDYLVKTSPELSDVENAEYAEKFLKIVVNATNFARDNGFSNYRTWWQFSELISQVPHKFINASHVDLVDYWLDDSLERGLVAEEIGVKWLKRLLEHNDEHSLQLAIRVLGIIFKVIFVEREYGKNDLKESKLRTEGYYITSIIEKNTRLVGKKLGHSAAEILDSHLKMIFQELSNDSWSAIWQPAIEDHEQNKYKGDAENYLIYAYRNILDGFMASKPLEAKAYIKKMMEDEFQTIHRLGIYTINNNYSLCTDFIDDLLEEKYFESNYRHEMWHLLNRNYEKFVEPQKKKVLQIILNISKTDEDGNVHDSATAYNKAIWLAAIKGHGSEEEILYNDNVKLAKAEPEHPDFSSYVSVGFGGRKSPVSIEELQSYPIEEVVRFLTSYNDTGEFRDPGIEGLTRAFRQVVKTEPLKFYNQLSKFADLDLAYIYEIVGAYRDLWSDKAQLPWDDIWLCLLAFCQKVIRQDRFWSVALTEQRNHSVANRQWIVSEIGRLIESGTKSDDHAFNEKYLKDAEEIIVFLLEKEEGEHFREDSDAVLLSINSPRGHCLEALINLTLRCCRLADKTNDNNHSEVWDHFQPLFDAELIRSDAEKPEYEFATLVTNYLPNFLYISKDWVMENLAKIFDQANYQKWLCAIQGYSYVGTIYEEIYQYLKDNGDLLKALDDKNVKERVDERIIQNIAVAYINDFEKLSDGNSLINTLLNRKNSDELGHLIWFVWSLRKDDNANLKNKIIELWPKIISSIDFSTSDGKKIASKLCDWAIFIDRIDVNNMELLLTVAPYANEDFNAYNLLESLAKISKYQPFEAHTIWMKMLEGDVMDYPKEAFIQIYENLLSKGPVGLRKAKEVVSEYIKKGYERPSIWLSEVRQGVESA